MAAKRKSSEEENVSVLEKAVADVEADKLPIEEMPLETLRDYRLYNEEARKANKKLRMCRYPIKQCPVELHPQVRVRFGNNDKSLNPVSVFLSNHLIHFDKKLHPGKEYDLPECIVAYLSEKGYPVWDWVTIGPNGEKETRMVNKVPRFSLTTVYQGYNE